MTLSGLPRTLLFTLRARAEEDGRPDSILTDPLARDWYGRVPQSDALRRVMAKAYTPVFQLGTAVRARLYDEIAGRFIDGRPRPLIVELGAGLSTRFHRLADGRTRWVSLDLPEAITFRRQVDQETDRHTFLAASMLDESWPDQLLPADPVDILFIAEGVLFFLGQAEIERLFALVNGRFPGALFAFDILTEGFNPKAQTLFAASDAPMQWFVSTAADLSVLGIAVQAQQVVTHSFQDRWQRLGISPDKLRRHRGNVLIESRLTGKNVDMS